MKKFILLTSWLMSMIVAYGQQEVGSTNAQSALSKVDRHFFIETKGNGLRMYFI